MARYGRLTFSISYIVDMDDSEMIDAAREMLADDVDDAIRYREVGIAAELTPDDTATEADVPEYLIELRKEQAAS